VARSPYSATALFGPGPITPAVKTLIWANVGTFLAQWLILERLVPNFASVFGLLPVAVFERLWLWQPVTYLFLHADPIHLILNMLALWMFGVDLERRWGSRNFYRYYFVCGVGAAITSLVASWLPFEFSRLLYHTPTVGASGAIYGLLLAFGLLFPYRTIYFLIFPVPARVYVFIAGALVLSSSLQDVGGGTAHLAHLGGMIFGYAYLRRGRGGILDGLKYRWVRWRMSRAKKRFELHKGGRGWNERIH
jgi:membrane associated rhomboid family serine protease